MDGDDSPVTASSFSSEMSRCVHATANGATGPSVMPSCAASPWNCGHSAHATTGVPITSTAETAATRDRYGAREVWVMRERRKAASS